jgi:hypothetical protein
VGLRICSNELHAGYSFGLRVAGFEFGEISLFLLFPFAFCPLLFAFGSGLCRARTASVGVKNRV